MCQFVYKLDFFARKAHTFLLFLLCPQLTVWWVVGRLEVALSPVEEEWRSTGGPSPHLLSMEGGPVEPPPRLNHVLLAWPVLVRHVSKTCSYHVILGLFVRLTSKVIPLPCSSCLQPEWLVSRRLLHHLWRRSPQAHQDRPHPTSPRRDALWGTGEPRTLQPAGLPR